MIVSLTREVVALRFMGLVLSISGYLSLECLGICAISVLHLVEQSSIETLSYPVQYLHLCNIV